jgi:hypothetical protein
MADSAHASAFYRYTIGVDFVADGASKEIAEIC